MKKMYLIFAMSSLLGSIPVVHGMDIAVPICTITVPELPSSSNKVMVTNNRQGSLSCVKKGDIEKRGDEQSVKVYDDYGILAQLISDRKEKDHSLLSIKLSPDEKTAYIEESRFNSGYSFNSTALIDLFKHHPVIELCHSSLKKNIRLEIMSFESYQSLARSDGQKSKDRSGFGKKQQQTVLRHRTIGNIVTGHLNYPSEDIYEIKSINEDAGTITFTRSDPHNRTADITLTIENVDDLFAFAEHRCAEIYDLNKDLVAVISGENIAKWAKKYKAMQQNKARSMGNSPGLDKNQPIEVCQTKHTLRGEGVLYTTSEVKKNGESDILIMIPHRTNRNTTAQPIDLIITPQIKAEIQNIIRFENEIGYIAMHNSGKLLCTIAIKDIKKHIENSPSEQSIHSEPESFLGKEQPKKDDSLAWVDDNTNGIILPIENRKVYSAHFNPEPLSNRIYRTESVEPSGIKLKRHDKLDDVSGSAATIIPLNITEGLLDEVFAISDGKSGFVTFCDERKTPMYSISTDSIKEWPNPHKNTPKTPQSQSFMRKNFPPFAIGLLGVILLYCASRFNTSASQFVDAAFYRLDGFASRK